MRGSTVCQSSNNYFGPTILFFYIVKLRVYLMSFFSFVIYIIILMIIIGLHVPLPLLIPLPSSQLLCWSSTALFHNSGLMGIY